MNSLASHAIIMPIHFLNLNDEVSLTSMIPIPLPYSPPYHVIGKQADFHHFPYKKNTQTCTHHCAPTVETKNGKQNNVGIIGNKMTHKLYNLDSEK